MMFSRAVKFTKCIIDHCKRHNLALINDYNNFYIPENIKITDKGIYYIHDTIETVWFLNDSQSDEGMYCTEKEWIKRTFGDKRFVSRLEVDSVDTFLYQSFNIDSNENS